LFPRFPTFSFEISVLRELVPCARDIADWRVDNSSLNLPTVSPFDESASYDPMRQCKKFGTHLQMRFVRRRKIHFKLQKFVLERETQHSPGTQKVGCLSNRQSVCPLNNLQNAGVAFRLRVADEQDVTTP